MIDKEFYIQKYKQLYREIYNLDFSDELATKYFDKMVILFKILMGVLPEVDKEEW